MRTWDRYDLILHDLRARRHMIDEAIKCLEALEWMKPANICTVQVSPQVFEMLQTETPN